MIRQETILAMTPIATALTEKNIDLSEKVGDIVKGLNDASGSLNSYTADNIVTELPEATKEGQHSDIQSVIYPGLAAAVRSSLGVISKMIKPVLVETDRNIRMNLCNQGVLDSAMNYIRVDMTNMEPEFLTSGMCPVEIPASFASNPQINVNDLVKGNWPRSENAAELTEQITVENNVLYPFFRDPEEVNNVYNRFFVDKYFWSIFDSGVREGDTINVLNPTHYKFKSFRDMVILSLLVNKFRSMDTPWEGVMGVGLDDYRANLNFLRDLCNTVLARFRSLWLERAKAGLVILDEDTKFGPATYGNMEGVNVISGTVRIGYNNAMLDMFTEKDEASIVDYALGYVFAKIRGYRVKDVVTDSDVVIGSFKEYINDLESAQRKNFSTVGKEAFLKAASDFCKDPANETVVELIKADVPAAGRLGVAISQKLDLGMFFSNEYMMANILDEKTSTLQTALAVNMAEVFGSPMAAEILKNNMNGENSSPEHQRKVLTGSIIAAIIKRLV